jgi:small subunit ribosomal protein S8
MSMTDPIADMLTRIRNAALAGHTTLTLPASRVKRDIAAILERQGFISSMRYEDDGLQGLLHIELKYGPGGEQLISGIERVSKPGRRVYIGRREIPEVLGGMGISILSTSRGILDGHTARSQGVGGEWLCNVW